MTVSDGDGSAPRRKRAKRPYTGPTCGGLKTDGTLCTQPAGWGTDHPGQGKCKLHGGKSLVRHGRYRKVKSAQLQEYLKDFEDEEDPYDLLPEVNMLRALVLDFINRHSDTTEALLAWHASYGPAYEKALADWQADYERWRTGWESWQAEWKSYRERVEQVQHHYRFGWPEPPTVPDLEIVIAGCPPPPPDPMLFQGKPRQMTDLLAAGRFLSDITAIVERIHKIRDEGAISLVTLKDVLQRFGVEMAQGVMETVPDQDDALRSAILAAVESRWQGISLASVGVGTRAGSRRGAG